MQSSNKKLDARVPQSEIGRVYDEIASVYNMWGRLTETKARSRALELAEIQDGQHILEVAVGTGLAFYEIVRRNPHGRNLGIDLSKGMLEKAKQRLQILGSANYSLQVGTAFHLQEEDESMDTLVNNYMFDLIPFEAMGRILAEFKRVLKKGGKLILVNMTEGERWGSRVYDRIYNWSPKLMGGCRGVMLRDTLHQHGFKVETREYHQQLLFPSEVIRAYKSV
ncbi:MAG: methyltransferase domain-containing protein [Anaerolineales bacterium]|nr:methyltransferase domain-containing protein [Anaerolineales bacterium]